MNESSKTLAFVISAAVMVGLAVTSHFVNLPKNQSEFELVGTDFFPGFDSSEQAKSLEVVAVDPKDLTLQRFSVENKNGLWRIPSHHNYPAEAAARLAETATSVMGIRREALAGRLASEQARLGVVDPLSDEIDDPESVGKRITFKDADNEVLVDYIVGKEAGEVEMSNSDRELQASRDPQKYYFIRRADEPQTYKVKLEIDLSTRFSDWIDPDLLRFDRNNLTQIKIDNYSLEPDPRNPQALLKVMGDELALTRTDTATPWVLAGLNEKTEQLEVPRINEIVDVLSELKIGGVRPKFKFKGHLLLTQDLKLNQRPEFEEDKRAFALAIQQLQAELEDKGFSLAGSAAQLELVSQNGQLQIGTNEGVSYFLQIGREVEGEEKAIEIGESAESRKSEKTEGDENKEDKTATDPGDQKLDAKNRYLVVRVAFDETLLGGRPVKPTEPVEPTKPEGYVPAPSESADNPDDKKSAEDKAGEPGQADKNESDGEAADKDAAPKLDDRDPAFIQYDAELKAFEQRKVNYEIELTRYDDAVKEFEKKIEAGKKIVDELNLRFGDWYYVVTADNLKTLQTTRKDLVAEKEIPEEEKIPSRPDISFPPESGTGEESSEK